MSETTNPYADLTRIDYPLIEENTAMPPLTRDAIRNEARSGLEEIRDFVTTDVFVATLGELYDLAPEERDQFVRENLLDPAALAARGITVPAGLKIQRSVFGDGRPTIFCVTKLMSDGIRKVTYTFDSGSLPARV